MRAPTLTHGEAQVWACPYTHVNMCTESIHTYMHRHRDTHICTDTYIDTYTQTHTHIEVYKYMHIHLYTYTHRDQYSQHRYF